jgi:aminoglycoside phosphotransferase (APT) family kinase protein
VITKPSIDDLLEGVTRTLEGVILPQLEGRPAAQAGMEPVLGVLARIANQWSADAVAFTQDSDDIEATLRSVLALLRDDATASLAAGVERSLASLPLPQPSPRALADRNNLLKSAVVSAIDSLDLPAGPEAPEPAQQADAAVRALLRRMLEREIAAVPPVVATTRQMVGFTGVPDPIEEMTGQLERFIASEVPGATNVRVRGLQRMVGGASRETWFFDATWDDASGSQAEHCVLQREAVSSVLESDVAEGQMTGSRRRPESEVRVVRAMERLGIPVPHFLWLDRSGTWLGRPFAVSRRLPGSSDDSVLLEEAQAANRARILGQYAEILGRIHTLDYRAAGLDFLGDPTRETAALEQLRLFEDGFHRQRLEEHPAISYAIAWLKKHVPVASRVSFIHGDYRRGNYMFEGGTIHAILDWEQCHVGDAMEEIAFMYWTYWTLEALIPLDDFLALYERHSGIAVNYDALAFYRVFIELKMVVVILTGIKSYFGTEHRQLSYAASPNAAIAIRMLGVLNELDAGGPFYDFRVANTTAYAG